LGIDLNPLACLLAKAKCTPIRPEILEKAGSALLENIEADIIMKI